MRSKGLLFVLCALCAIPAMGQPLVTGPVVVFLGPPGSGKSLQAAEAAKFLKVPVVSASDLVKENEAALKKVRASGITGIEPETDPLLNKFFEERLRKGDLTKGMILDGYPNTKDQADFGSKLVASGVISKPLVLHLEVPDDIVRKRVGGPGGKLSDSLEQRLKDYHRETIALEVYFPNAEIVKIDGTKKPKAVTKAINKVLKSKYGR